MPQNFTISQFKYVTLLPGLVTMVTMKIFVLDQVQYQTTVKWSTIFDYMAYNQTDSWKMVFSINVFDILPAFTNVCCHFVSMATNVFILYSEICFKLNKGKDCFWYRDKFNIMEGNVVIIK